MPRETPKRLRSRTDAWVSLWVGSPFDKGICLRFARHGQEKEGPVKPREVIRKAKDKSQAAVKKNVAELKLLHWRHWDDEKRFSFVVNICVGVIMAVLFQFLSQTHLMEKGLNRALDELIRKETGALLASSRKCTQGEKGSEAHCAAVASKFSKKVAFIDIDHETYVRWGEPLVMPRSELARFIGLADRNGARVVVLDILLDYPSPKPGDDKALRKVLEEMTRRRSPLKIVFPAMTSRIDGTLKRNVFDDIISKNPNFHLAIPYVALSHADRVVRYLRYYEVVKDREGKERVLWATSVLSVALYTGDFDKLRNLEARILEDSRRKRYEAYGVTLSAGTVLDISNHELYSNRIRFSLIPAGTLDSQGNLFTERVLPDEVDALQEELRDKIVVVGTSSADKEGWYPTPVGDMPGMYIIGNGINMVMGGWQVRDAPRWLGICLQAMVILFAAFMLVNFRGRSIRIVTAVIIIGIVSPLTYYFYRTQGIFINSAQLFFNSLMPIMAMGWGKILRRKKKKEEDEAPSVPPGSDGRSTGS